MSLQPSSTHIVPVLALAREILVQITERKLVEVQSRLDTVFDKYDVMEWIGGKPSDVSIVLDALGRGLSRNCRWRPDAPDKSCRFLLLDSALDRRAG